MLGAAALAPAACSDRDSTTVYTGNQISDYAATWDGYAEAFQFEDGTDRVRVTISLDGHGTVQVGDWPLTPPPTDPSVGYPAAPWKWNTVWGRVGEELKPGFRFEISQTRVDTARLRFGVDYHDMYREWCAMQSSHPMAPAGETSTCLPDWYNTVPSDDGTSCAVTDGLGQPVSGVDCVQVLVCQIPNPTWLCPCDAGGCAVPSPANGIAPIQIDGALEMDGRQFVGTLANNDTGTRYTIRLTRQ